MLLGIRSLTLFITFLTLTMVLEIAHAQNTSPSKMQMDHSQMNQTSNDKINVAVLLYDGALLLDYGIAAEMFLAADYMRKFDVYTVSASQNVSVSILEMVQPDFICSDAPKPDVIIVPGGPTWSQEAASAETVKFLKQNHANGTALFSICTGSLLLAKAGLLENRPATTNHEALKVLQELSPTTTVKEDARFVDDGDIITTAGAGTAIEATLHLIGRLTNPEIAENLAEKYLNYPHSYSH
jgi:transcriptional regulator GlxA family with amidase domain